MSSAPSLSIVIPAFNEVDRIAATVSSWSREVTGRGIPHEILVYDDGSTDATPARLEAVARERPDVRVTRQTNRGHGPTVLRGYREAAGEWILQIDGDDEVGVDPFASFWNARENADLVIGRREGRQLGMTRHALSRSAALAVRLWFGGSITDVNSPYRLMRRSMLDRLLCDLAPDVFAPNVLLTGLAVREGFRVVERPVLSRAEPQRRRASWNAARAASVAFRQLLRTAASGGRSTGEAPRAEFGSVTERPDRS